MATPVGILISLSTIAIGTIAGDIAFHATEILVKKHPGITDEEIKEFHDDLKKIILHDLLRFKEEEKKKR